jgi:N-acetylglucosaminyl-diphospho-decaprenol L-rhamnosyltransferase
MAPVEPSVSVIVVSYNTRELLLRCLRSIPSECEMIVVDNASHDGSAEAVQAEFPDAVLIRNTENRGFGAANNQGLAVSTGELALLLNSDAMAHEGAIERLTREFSNSDVIAAGGMLQNPDGSLQESAASELTLYAVLCEQLYLEKLFSISPILSPYWQSRRLIAKGLGPHAVAQVMGACLMMRKVEKFDERFFLYCEDTELCKRLRRHGRILYVPEARFTHELGSSSTSNRWRSIALYNKGKELYFSIHEGPVQALVCRLLNRTGALLRLFVWGVPTIATLGLVRAFRDRAAMFWRVLFARI